ncbi:MAG: TetR/AcrR family transcriptional regulator [Candidatus Fimimonas sp.]
MTDTKEKILQTALRLFAAKGYEAVSVSEIATELNITKGALYKHYKNKRDVFNSIVARMYQTDAERSREYGVPEQPYQDSANGYESVTIADVKNFTLAQFTFWCEDEFACNFRKMLTLEQFGNAEMAELYSRCLTFGPVCYMQDVFAAMMKNGVLKSGNAQQLAVEFYAPLFLLISICDVSRNKQECERLLQEHVERFFLQNAVS